MSNLPHPCCVLGSRLVPSPMNLNRDTQSMGRECFFTRELIQLFFFFPDPQEFDMIWKPENLFSVHEPLFLSGLRPTIMGLLTPGFKWCLASFPLHLGLAAFPFSLTPCYHLELPTLTSFCTIRLIQSFCIWPVLDTDFSGGQASFSPVSA